MVANITAASMAVNNMVVSMAVNTMVASRVNNSSSNGIRVVIKVINSEMVNRNQADSNSREVEGFNPPLKPTFHPTRPVSRPPRRTMYPLTNNILPTEALRISPDSTYKYVNEYV